MSRLTNKYTVQFFFFMNNLNVETCNISKISTVGSQAFAFIYVHTGCPALVIRHVSQESMEFRLLKIFKFLTKKLDSTATFLGSQKLFIHKLQISITCINK